ncbi:dolichyl-phosphate beta-glucosyltransferase [Geodermatophilus sp. DSM 44513]|uniref:dolichyl-phosphate beta-glucosyltransferase n=1 Tax=Geodermatophilus sp. DSM 44513 TaxID=1528104 RepID=UPI00126BB7A6|nr:dolichyl-phosphate beta-glucosyltransferase [Geodermatophilus sp. DSM 44513]WNV75876.1 glycosyltransferase family 2 protein [Geodermatophilus sp. DSM 44513]
MSQRTPDLDVVVPAYNEEARLGATLRALADHLATLPVDARVTVVDNGSVDRSAEVVDEVAELSPDNVALRLIGCARQGKGAAVRRGILAGTARWRGFCDADLSTPPQVLTDVVAHLERGAPVVIGSRRAPGASYVVPQPLVRRFGSSTFRMLTRPLVGQVADTQCGFKFFSAEAAEQVFRRVTVNGFAFDVEVLAVAHRLGLPVVEVPVRWTDQAGSSFHVWSHGRRVLSEVAAVRASLARMS